MNWLLVLLVTRENYYCDIVVKSWKIWIIWFEFDRISEKAKGGQADPCYLHIYNVIYRREEHRFEIKYWQIWQLPWKSDSISEWPLRPWYWVTQLFQASGWQNLISPLKSDGRFCASGGARTMCSIKCILQQAWGRCPKQRASCCILRQHEELADCKPVHSGFHSHILRSQPMIPDHEMCLPPTLHLGCMCSTTKKLQQFLMSCLGALQLRLKALSGDLCCRFSPLLFVYETTVLLCQVTEDKKRSRHITECFGKEKCLSLVGNSFCVFLSIFFHCLVTKNNNSDYDFFSWTFYVSVWQTSETQRTDLVFTDSCQKLTRNNIFWDKMEREVLNLISVLPYFVMC